MKSSNKQKHMHTYVSPQESYTGRTAKNMYVTRKEKMYIHAYFQRKTSYTCTKPNNEQYYLRLIFQRILDVFLFIPIHCIF